MVHAFKRIKVYPNIVFAQLLSRGRLREITIIPNACYAGVMGIRRKEQHH